MTYKEKLVTDEEFAVMFKRVFPLLFLTKDEYNQIYLPAITPTIAENGSVLFLK